MAMGQVFPRVLLFSTCIIIIPPEVCVLIQSSTIYTNLIVNVVYCYAVNMLCFCGTLFGYVTACVTGSVCCTILVVGSKV